MISVPEAEEFARKWVCTWNSHDIDRILEHCNEDFEMMSKLSY